MPTDALDRNAAERRALHRGYDDGLTAAFELAIVPAVLGAVGYGVDRLLGTNPGFLIAMVVVAFVGLFAKHWTRYERRMQVEEAKVFGRPVPEGLERPGDRGAA